MKYCLLFLTLFVQINASGYADYTPKENCAQQILNMAGAYCHTPLHNRNPAAITAQPLIINSKFITLNTYNNEQAY